MDAQMPQKSEISGDKPKKRGRKKKVKRRGRWSKETPPVDEDSRGSVKGMEVSDESAGSGLDSMSAVSDLNPPSYKTRSVRGGRKGSRSVAESRKAESEPVIITLDSESEDERMTTRSKTGDVIKKLSRMGIQSKNRYTEDSDSEHKVKKRKYRKKTLLKRHRGRPKTLVYSPLKRRSFWKMRGSRKITKSDRPFHINETLKTKLERIVDPLRRKSLRSNPANPDYHEDEESEEDAKLAKRISSRGRKSVEEIKEVPRSLSDKLVGNSTEDDVDKTKMVEKKKLGRPRKYFPVTSNQEKEKVKEVDESTEETLLPFLQEKFCFEDMPKLSKCRECRNTQYKEGRKVATAYCRFMKYRKLCYDRKGNVSSFGFCCPEDATHEEISEWLPQPDNPPKDLDKETAKSLLAHCGDQFCNLIGQEEEALLMHKGKEQSPTWKKLVAGVREMCDVCETTIFNVHWVCPECGFAVCGDCYRVRLSGVPEPDEDDEPRKSDRDDFDWLLCNAKVPHELEKLVIAHIIPGNALDTMKRLLHDTREKWGIPSYCKCYTREEACPVEKSFMSNLSKKLMSQVAPSFLHEKCGTFDFDAHFGIPKPKYDRLDQMVQGSALFFLNQDSGSDGEEVNSYEDCARFRDTFLHEMPEDEEEVFTCTLEDIVACFQDDAKTKPNHFEMRYPQPESGSEPLPIRTYTLLESQAKFPDVPHEWLCNGRLLVLTDPGYAGNLTLFKEMWQRGQPVLVQHIDQRLDMGLWRPEGFSRDFGDIKNDLVDCRSGAILKNYPMRKFWEGFQDINKRLIDEHGHFRLLKLKDWPPGEDFSEMLPSRFEDLMKALPLPQYTHRDGILNLAGRLPPSFVKPDLGPKMYNAYGSALFPSNGTTNLHLDMSDAVNVMVFVGIPRNVDAEIHIREAYKAIDDGGCDSMMRKVVRLEDSRPGALWHIFHARDADKIRDLLKKVAVERGEKLEARADPIHDQCWYLDEELRSRLYSEYGVEGYAIAQCLGEAVFIPAGAPHQVRNLHSCVKVAEDFVSPENIAHCFSLTQEFRNLSDRHTNHEDKLQIKNIIYHVVRDALSHLPGKEYIKGPRESEANGFEEKEVTKDSEMVNEKEVAGESFEEAADIKDLSD